jgi:hypothetical protein
MAQIQRVFTVDGRPFFPLGGQARNSSGFNRAEAERAFQVVRALHGNTVEIPVYWAQVEPEEGRFEWGSVTDLLALAEEYDLRLILLWFATWKNGDMDYAPAWVKMDPERFPRVVSPTGKAIWSLSPHAETTLAADRAAFGALCAFLRDNDSRGAVIGLQIENEPGILGSPRDYGPAGEAAYRGPVPAALIDRLRAAGAGRVYDIWQAAGGRGAGSWEEVFGWEGGELLTAWAIARYVDRIAEAGKRIVSLPMYANVWLGEVEWGIAGDSYPSGGAVTKVLDIYRWFAPYLDLIAPDIYPQDPFGFRRLCEAYSRDDNPLLVPESPTGGANAWNIFRAIADHNAIGYACFGVERMLEDDGTFRPAAQELAGSWQAVAAAIPLILKYQGSGRLHAVAQDEYLAYQLLDLDGYLGLVQFGDAAVAHVNKDWRHPTGRPLAAVGQPSTRGRGLVIQAGEHEFYVVGGGFQLLLRRKTSPEQAMDITVTRPWLMPRATHYVSVEEGSLDADGVFHVERRRTGDETDHGIWVEPDVKVVRVILCD